MIKYIFSILFFISTFLSMAESDTLPLPSVAGDAVGVPDTLTVIIGISEADTVTNAGIEKSTDYVKGSTQARQEIGTPGDVINVISFSKIFWTIVIIVLSYLIIRFVVKILEAIAERSTKLRIGLKSIIPVVRILLWLLVVFVIIKGIYNPPKETYLAMWASAAIAIGLAAQDLLKNVFGGIMLLFDRPFQVGDKIETGKHYGEVIEIGLRATRIVTPDDSVVSVPNMELMNSSVSNANSGELNCQVVAEIYLPIDVDTQQARKIAVETAQISRFIYLEKPIVVVFFNEVKERRSYLKMRLKAYVMDIRYEFQFKSDMTEIVIRELLKQGVIRKGDLF